MRVAEELWAQLLPAAADSLLFSSPFPLWTHAIFFFFFLLLFFFVMHWSLKLGQSRREHKAKSLRIIKRRWQQQQTSSPLLCSLTLSADDPLARTTNNLYIHNYIHAYLNILVRTILLRNGCRSAYLTDLIIISEPSGSLPPARSSSTRQVKIERKKWKLRSLTRK